MDDYSYILFNKSPQQLRRIGARGGKALRVQRAPPPRPTACAATRSPLAARSSPSHHR